MRAWVLSLLLIAPLQDPGAVERQNVLRRLSDSNRDVVWQAIQDAEKLDLREAAPRLLELLANDDLDYSAGKALEYLEIEIDSVALLLRVDKGEVSYHAAGGLLIKWIRPEQEPAVLESFRNKNSPWQMDALDLMGRRGFRSAVKDALSWVEKSDHPYRKQAARYLVDVQAPEAVPALRRWMTSKEPHQCLPAIQFLAELEAKDVGPDVLAVLREGHKIHQFTYPCGFSVGIEWSDYSKLMSRTRPELVVPTLEAWLKDPVADFRCHAARLLGYVSHAPSIPKVAALLKDPEASVRVSAIRGLHDMKARDRVGEVCRLESDSSESVRAAAADCLGAWGGLEAQAALRRFAHDKSAGVRSSALEGLAEADPEACGSLVIDVLKEDESQAVEAAVKIAHRLSLRGAVPGLVRHLDSKDKHLVESVLEALLALRATPQADEIFRRLDRWHPVDREDAAAISCSLGSRKGGEYLVKEAGRNSRIPLAPLNALREPTSWNAIVTLKVGTDPISLSELMAEGARRAGLAYREPTHPGVLRQARVKHDWGWTSVDEILCYWDEGISVLVERDHIRIVPTEEALRFWKTWLADNR